MLKRVCNVASRLTQQSTRLYTPHEIQSRSENTSQGYYKDPNEVASKICRLVAMHEKTEHVDLIDLDATWHKMGVDQLTLVEIMLEAEDEFYLELPDEEVERFKNIRDATEYISRSFYTAY